MSSRRASTFYGDLEFNVTHRIAKQAYENVDILVKIAEMVAVLIEPSHLW